MIYFGSATVSSSGIKLFQVMFKLSRLFQVPFNSQQLEHGVGNLRQIEARSWQWIPLQLLLHFQIIVQLLLLRKTLRLRISVDLVGLFRYLQTKQNKNKKTFKIT
jgi:hypothetical protein